MLGSPFHHKSAIWKLKEKHLSASHPLPGHISGEECDEAGRRDDAEDAHHVHGGAGDVGDDVIAGDQLVLGVVVAVVAVAGADEDVVSAGILSVFREGISGLMVFSVQLLL